MKVRLKRRREVIEPDQVNDIGEVLVAPGRELQINQGRQADHIGILDDFADELRIWISNRAWFTTSRKKAAYQEINGDLIDAIDESVCQARMGSIIFWNPALAKARKIREGD